MTSSAPLKPASVHRLLRPRSVAIVGVSPSPTALGSNVLRNLEHACYAGDIYLINPKHSQIGERHCYGSLDELPDGVDCAVLAVPRAAIVDLVAACARKRIGGVIVFSAGFAEAGDQGRADQAVIADIARSHDMTVVGPNCLGMVNYIDGVPLTFVDDPAPRLGEKPGMAIISQSGAMASVLTVDLRARNLGLSFSVSTGNEAASGVEDYLEYMLADPHTSVIAMIVEQFRQPKRFLELAQRAQATDKRIVLLHPGRSSAARASAATHTGAMAGNYAVMRTLVTHVGVVVVDKLESLLDAAEILLRCAALPNRGAAMITESGAFKALTLDLCEQIGLELPSIGEETDAALRKVLPGFVPPCNPLDLTAQALVDPDLYNRTLEVLLADESYGSLVLGIILSDAATCEIKFPPILESLKRLRPAKPVIFAALDEGAQVPPVYIAELHDLGIPFFSSAERALQALAYVTTASSQQPASAPTSAVIADDLPFTSGVMPEYKSKEVLAAIGIPVPAAIMATSLEDAQAAALKIGFPVVLKAQAAALLHKSDAGGVVLNLTGPESLRDGWRRLHEAVGAARPSLRLDGVLVEKMGQRGTELIVGARNDADWGPVLLVGFGGILAEALGDIRLLSPDLSREEIAGELYRLKTAALLRGFRGSPALDVAAVAGIVYQLGALIRRYPRILEVDINPVVLYAKGSGAVALDALIVTE
jgi:acyl-CoA synthetase (NDP forming)